MAITWYFINSGACSPSYNMALDEALLHWHSNGEMPPVIRFYEWNPATLSIGYFQKAHRDVDFDQLHKHNVGFVRRPTGGRAVLHEHELTYSIVVSESYPNMPKTVTEAYRVLSEGLLNGFINLGLDAYFSVPQTEAEKLALQKPKSAVCFDAPSWYELVVEGRKIAGSAQTRQEGVILQHGSLLIDLDQEKLLSIFKFKDEAAREKMRQNLPLKTVAMNDLGKGTFTTTDCVKAFKRGFEEALEINLQPYTLTDEQRQFVEQLAQTKYESDEWNFKK
ncbi:lipoate--protein ligase family protein [Kurthia senegalensis]|uniref:lipoate--protein ligase family protein n=1 Tax=Kurthia senegalensis TaxID=1033740 RepID=UPI000287E094|nr:biotin/lipoate A/B protein ligase family protein [Kurthia senegalensis]